MSTKTPTQEVLRCSTTADFLAALPLLTGFTASNSIFVVFFSGRRASRTMRLDLPPDESPTTITPLLDFISSALHRFSGAERSSPAIVITTDLSFAAAAGAPWKRLAQRLERRLRRDGYSPRELCCVASDAWVSYLDPRAPLLGRPLDEISASSVVAQSPAAKREVRDLADLGALPAPDPIRAAALVRALDAEPPLSQAVARDAVWMLDTCSMCRAFLNAGDRLPPEAAAGFLRMIQRPERWFVLALGMLTRPGFPLELAQEWPPGSFECVEIDGPIGHGPRPLWSIKHLLSDLIPEESSHGALAHVRELIECAAADAPAQLQPAALAFCAWLWWACGNQTVAQRQAKTALKISPGNELAIMVSQLVAQPPRGAWVQHNAY